MQNFTRKVLNSFTSKENISHLYSRLDVKLPREELERQVYRYSNKVYSELVYSEALPTASVRDVLHEYNCEFVDYINDLYLPRQTPKYTISDGQPISTSSCYSGNKNDKYISTADMLARWKVNSNRGTHIREDTGADGVPMRCPVDGDDVAIEFCDQSSLGTQQHYQSFMNNSYFRALNSEDMTEGRFGNKSDSSDMRLLSRSVFRKNEEGVENGIPKYRQWMHHRHIDRDNMNETLPNAGRSQERESFNYRHDRASLIEKLDRKNRF